MVGQTTVAAAVVVATVVVARPTVVGRRVVVEAVVVVASSTLHPHMEHPELSTNVATTVPGLQRQGTMGAQRSTVVWIRMVVGICVVAGRVRREVMRAAVVVAVVVGATVV